MNIRDFYPDQTQFNAEDIKKFVDYNISDYYLREVTSNTYWHIEACFDKFVSNKSITIIFNYDVMSPYTLFNHLEAQNIVDKLNEQFNDVIKAITR